MNTSNKTLLQILIEELPKNGGWPEGSPSCRQFPDGEICFKSVSREHDIFTDLACDVELSWRFTHEPHVTREQYDAAMAGSRANDNRLESDLNDCIGQHNRPGNNQQ